MLITGSRFLPAVSRGNRGPLFFKIRKTQTVTQPLPLPLPFLTFDMCSDCLVLLGSLPCDCFLLNLIFNHLKPYFLELKSDSLSDPAVFLPCRRHHKRRHFEPSRGSPCAANASEGNPRLSSWKLLHILASCPDPRTPQNL